jgi:hypothetical protein
MEDLLSYVFAYFWVWIPLAGIAAGSFSEWLKYKEKTAKLSVSTAGLEKSHSAMEAENKELLRRIQNLEAIVTHEVWEAAQSKADPATKAARIDASLLTPEPTDAERAASLAGRLRA